MFGVLEQALALLFEPFSLAMIFVGVAGGIIVGALPGLTATMGVAVLVPFTFRLPPVPGILMLLGLYVGAIYGGSISAILIRTPGTPSAAATLLDGYPMALKGEGGRALGIAAIASSFGGIVSLILLISISPLLSRFALSFSAPEYFALALFGLTIIVSISSDSVVKGLIAGVFGLLVASIGIDPIGGYTRFTFGRLELMSGAAFIPTLIGLFAVAEALSQFENFVESKALKQSVKSIIPSKEDFGLILPTLMKSSIIGTFIGALPGAGADISAFVCYNEAKRSSKHPERFGKGEIIGVAAAESGNNAATGGALIPTLSLGVPGDSVTAILIGALMIQGLRPGPLLFQDHLDMVWAIFIGLFIAKVLISVFGILGAGFVARLVSLSKRTLIPIIMVLSIVGAFAMNNNTFDIGLMLFFGVLGYLMMKVGMPPSPIVLALILGPMAEANFRRALAMSYGNFSIFFTRPISLILILLSIVSVVGTILRQKRLEKKALEGENIGVTK
ncbi:MAG: tripartite tricarboxylate transporter permease [Dethiobacteria bacterium]|jgi:putative tricarboxylic transport membrane protein